jgi:hypothetical protein
MARDRESDSVYSENILPYCKLVGNFFSILENDSLYYQM